MSKKIAYTLIFEIYDRSNVVLHFEDENVANSIRNVVMNDFSFEAISSLKFETRIDEQVKYSSEETFREDMSYVYRSREEEKALCN
jgi:hypothetical protein